MGNTASVVYAQGAAAAEAAEKVEVPSVVAVEESSGAPSAEKPVVAESSEDSEPASSTDSEPAAPERPKIVLQTHYQLDPRYSNSNQAKACFVKYSEFHKCAAEEGEDSEKCKSFQRAYRSICPYDWVMRWNELREEGSWFGKF